MDWWHASCWGFSGNLEQMAMPLKWIRQESVVIGVICAILVIFFFLAVRDLRTSYVLYLHFYNHLVLAAAVFISLYRLNAKKGPLSYLDGLFEGFKTAATSALLSNLFLLLYFYFINPVYFLNVRTETQLGDYMNPLVVCLVFFTEEVCASLIYSLISMQFFKLS
jgi:hypothetical protein